MTLCCKGNSIPSAQGTHILILSDGLIVVYCCLLHIYSKEMTKKCNDKCKKISISNEMHNLKFVL